MIEKPTVLILGAGASRPYSFPSGQELKEKVLGALGRSAQGSVRDYIEQGLGVHDHSIRQVMTELIKCNLPSVDAFIETQGSMDPQRRIEKIGKMAMAGVLLPIEQACNFYQSHNYDGGWYPYLYNQMRTTRQNDFTRNRLSVITFNYDRSLEKFFLVSLSGTYGISEEDAARLLIQIPIIHVHGQLGCLPEIRHAVDSFFGNSFTSTAQSDLGYGASLNDGIRAAAENIEVVNSNTPPSNAFQHAQELIKQADQVIFLGFGYHDDNLHRLGMLPYDHGRNTPLILGSTYGHTTRQSKRIIQKIHGNCRLDTGDENSSDCLWYLKREVDLN